MDSILYLSGDSFHDVLTISNKIVYDIFSITILPINLKPIKVHICSEYDLNKIPIGIYAKVKIEYFNSILQRFESLILNKVLIKQGDLFSTKKYLISSPNAHLSKSMFS